VYRRISTSRGTVLSGNDGLVTARMQVSCVASTEVAAKRLAHSVLVAMGSVPGTTWGDHKVRCCLLDNELDGFDDVIAEGSHGIHSAIQDYMITYSQ